MDTEMTLNIEIKKQKQKVISLLNALSNVRFKCCSCIAKNCSIGCWCIVYSVSLMCVIRLL